MAQLVNIIGPIMTEPGRPGWRMNLFHPFALTANYAAGRVLRTLASSATYAGKTASEMPYLHAAVTEDETTGQVVVFALNRNLSEAMDLSVELRGFGGTRSVVEALQIHNPNMKAVNTKDAPRHRRPRAHRQGRHRRRPPHGDADAGQLGT